MSKNTKEECSEGVWSSRLMGIRMTVTEIAKKLGPDDDPMPVVIIDSLSLPGDLPADMLGEKIPQEAVGKPGVLVIGVDSLMQDDESKDSLLTSWRQWQF